MQRGERAFMNVEKLSVALTAEQAAMVRQAVETGEYATVSEVIREALRLWWAEQQARTHDLEELRRLWRAGIDSGSGEDGPAVFDRLRRRYRRDKPDADSE
jgi:antitoxin ParD1/3/4